MVKLQDVLVQSRKMFNNITVASSTKVTYHKEYKSEMKSFCFVIFLYLECHNHDLLAQMKISLRSYVEGSGHMLGVRS